MNNSVFLLLGPENGEKNVFINNEIKKIRKHIGGAPEIIKYYPHENKLNEMISVLKTDSLFSSFTIVIIKNSESIKLKAEVEQIINYIKNPSENSCVILQSDEIHVDSRIEKSVPASNKKIFWELFENQKKAWLINFFNKENMKIFPEAIELLLNLVENNTESFKNICEKLVVFFDGNTELTAEHLESFIYHSKEENVFTLFEKIAELDFEASLEVLEKLLLSGDNNSVQMFAGLLWQFRRLLSMKLMIEDNYSFTDACKKNRINSKRNQKIYNSGVNNFSIETLKKIIVLIADYDKESRLSRTELQAHLMKMFIYNLIKNKAKSAEDPFEISYC